jgi:hypothetical protein
MQCLERVAGFPLTSRLIPHILCFSSFFFSFFSGLGVSTKARKEGRKKQKGGGNELRHRRSMTFEKQLQFHAVTTWRRKYIAYGEVKKILKRIEQLLRDERVGQTAAGGLEEDGATSDEEGYVGHHHHHHEGEGLLVGKHRAAEVEEALEELELTFFRRLRDEQAKVDGFYHQQLQYLLTRSERLNDQLRSFEAASEVRHLFFFLFYCSFVLV